MSRSAKGLAWIVTESMKTSVVGRFFLPTGNFSSASSASRPSTRCPKTEYLSLRCGCASNVRKNWDRFVSGPLFAMDTTPRRSCALSGWNSSGNMPPQIDAPPLPVPVGSPVWTMNPGSSRWKRHPSYFPDAHSARKLNEQRGAVSQNSSSFKSPTPVWSVTAIAGGVARSRDGERRLITLQRVSQRRRGGTAAAPRLHVAAARVARGPRFVQFTCQFAWH
mmetsp:Transcript_24043/g.74131  ORF Transcript_24043/g.74131 Transcript_24043/m.74131 type:complete len:221 (+) Transcript_24043:55-717(+)